MTKVNKLSKILFTVSLIAGVAIGFFIYWEIPLPAPLSPPQPTTESDPKEYESILFVGVDQFTGGNSQLMSAWLVTVGHDENQRDNAGNIMLEALYPISPQNSPPRNLRLFSKPHSPISIFPHQPETLHDTLPLNIQNYSWVNVIYLDWVAMDFAIKYLDPNHPNPVLVPAANPFFIPWEQPEKAFSQQKSILVNMCNHPDEFLDFEIIKELLRLIPDHAYTTLSQDELKFMWQAFVNAGIEVEIHCEIYP